MSLDPDPDPKPRWREHLGLLGFREYGELGAMRASYKGVTFIAIPHPLHGLSIAATYVTPRIAYDKEIFVPLDAGADVLAKVVVGVIEELNLGE